jgi:predicted nucleotidyltransferase
MSRIDLPADGFIEVSQDALRDLCLRCHVRRLDLFGSAVTDRFDPSHSDLEMLVIFDHLSTRTIC